MNEALHIQVSGAVQGVGFRPFVYRLAKMLRLTGYVQNSNKGVTIEAEGPRQLLEQFILRLQQELPKPATIQSIKTGWQGATGLPEFSIRNSNEIGITSATILPDLATCPDCLKELFNPLDRRYRYPFLNCTKCGPRYTIVTALPYDRPNTAMESFDMCPDCLQEYNNPLDRRFHAQPNACPVCGPQLALWRPNGKVLATGDSALEIAAQAIRSGKVLAFKSIGGFQLMVDARNSKAVQLLRNRKHRPAKPLALIYPNLNQVKQDCLVTELEEQLLLSQAGPIVLLQKRPALKHTSSIAENVAPGNPQLGVMLPSTPMHHLLLKDLDFPVVATSGNLSNEPICTDAYESLSRLKGIADQFLVHNRPIVRPVDDSVVRVVAGQMQVLRSARGYATYSLSLPGGAPPILAAGGHLKNTVAIGAGNQVYLSQHIGNLDSELSFDVYSHIISDFKEIYKVKLEAVAADLHPDYMSTKYAEKLKIPLVGVQHHFAHVLACMADNSLKGPALGIAWDGTGLGSDGTLWGGEFLYVTDTGFNRVAHLQDFKLPGGEAAVMNPCRTALGMLYKLKGAHAFELDFLKAHFSQNELNLFKQMLLKDINSPKTTSAGRLFDGVAALLSLSGKVSFEGQAAMALEFAVQNEVAESYSFKIHKKSCLEIDWQPMLEQIVMDLKQLSTGAIAAKFHNTLVEMMLEVAHEVGEEKVVLTGGCFQNKYLTEKAVERLKMAGFKPYWHKQIPPNDGGLAVGQYMAVASQLSKRKMGEDERKEHFPLSHAPTLK